jgi:predicted hydrocarbon binding protein
MIFNSTKWKAYKWVAISIAALFIIGNLYALFFKTGGNTNVAAVLVLGLLLGAALLFLINKAFGKNNTTTIKESSHTIAESMRKVFKIVCAEGQFSELYDYEETRKFLSFIPSTKKALVIVKAKVLIGFDVEKCVWETDEETKTVKLVSFPEAEILSTESDYQYYNMENGILNRFGKDDLTNIQVQGKKQIEAAALKSDLPKMAAHQMRAVLTEVLHAKNWGLQNEDKIALLDNK